MHQDDDGVDIGTASGAAHYSKAPASPSTGTRQAKTSISPRRPSHRDKAAQQQRHRKFTDAADATTAAGFPIRFKACLTWHALTTAGERRDGNALHLAEGKRVSRLWRNLRGLYRKHGLPFYVMRAPENAADKGAHLHLALCLPDRLLPDLVAVLSHVTGAAQDIEATFTAKERNNGHIARSACRGWLVQRNLRVGAGGERGAAAYLSKAASRDGVNVQYRLSDALSALVRRHRAQISAQDGHKPALARVAA